MNPLITLMALALFLYGILYDKYHLLIYFALIALYVLLTQLGKVNQFNNKTRKMLIGSWNPPSCPNVFINYVWEISKAVEYIKEIKEKTKVYISITDYIMFCMSQAFASQSDFNGRFLFGNYLDYPDTDISLAVSSPDGREIDIVTHRNSNKKNISELAEERRNMVKNIKLNEYRKGYLYKIAKMLPTFLLQPILYGLGYASQNLLWSFNRFGICRRFFGSAIIVNTGKDGFEHSYFPIPSFAHIPLLLTINKIVKKVRPSSEDKCEVKDCINLSFTMDHRYTDGKRSEALYNKIIEFIENPQKAEDFYNKNKS